MITNQPEREEFETIAKQCLAQAFNIVYDIDSELEYFEGDPADVWEYRIGDLSTSLILIFQAIEAVMKGRVCQTSPLLLLDLKRTEWPTLPGTSDRDFTQLYTINGEALLRTYFSVIKPTRESHHLVSFIEEIRVARNRIVHGPARDYLDPEYLIICILQTFTYFFGKGSWWTSYQDQMINNPVNKDVNSGYQESWFQYRLDYVESVLEPADFRKHFSLNLNSRRYYCPHFLSQSRESDIESKWALLIPQGKSRTTEVHCVNCNRQFPVSRVKCVIEECKGDVIHSDEKHRVCLTCGNRQN